MSRYRGWEERFPRYVPLAERRARAATELARLAGRRGRAPEPVVIARQAIATTFWGRAWCDNLTRYMDYVNRLPRGRSYVRNGSVVDLAITPGQIRALVAGSELYTVTIGIAPLKRPRWRGVVARCAGRIGSLVALLRGELSDDVLAALVDAEHGLFPEPRDITMACSCPDRAVMCKHVAAVLYGVGARLDTQPDLFFALRQVDQAQLLTQATTGAIGRSGGSGKRISPDRLASVFGIELDDAAPAGQASRTERPSRLPRGQGPTRPGTARAQARAARGSRGTPARARRGPPRDRGASPI